MSPLPLVHWITDSPGTLRRNEIHIWRFDIDKPAADGRELLSETERQRLQQFRHAVPANRYLNTRTGVRQILAGYLRQPPANLEFDTAAGGKPRLVGENLQFNLSHSGATSLLAVAPDLPLGIDLEQLRPIRYADAIARRMFGEELQAELARLAPEDRPLLFFRHWTCMEARQKASGEGIFGSHSPALRFGCHQFMAAADQIAALAWPAQSPTVQLRFFTAPD